MTLPVIPMLDLFAGAGGMSAGFHDASNRFQTIRAVERDPAAAASYAATFGKRVVYNGSIESWLAEELVPRVDVIIGGPPCQGFSTLGKQNSEDGRNSLWRQYALTITRARPKYFVVENVAAFGKSAQFEDFKQATAPGGLIEDYDFQCRVLNAADYGAPQNRKRAVVIGHRRDSPFPGFPAPTHDRNASPDRLPHRTVRQALAQVPSNARGTELPENSGYEFEGRTFPGAFSAQQLHLERNYEELSKKRFAAIPIGGNRFDLPDELKAPCWIGHTSGSGDVMGRMHWDRPAVTIRTEFFKPEKGRYLHPSEMRAITHYEAALLQGFPPNQKFVGSKTSIARQIGNAVPIPLGSAVAKVLLSVL